MIRKLWIELRSSLWFVPSILVLIAVGLAVALVEVDIIYARELRRDAWTKVLNAGAEGARGMLSAISGSMITVVATVFSVTIVTLSLASTQYTPRILRNFMRNRSNQYVLGIFVAIYTYCLIVLRTIRGGSEIDGGFVPQLAVAFAMVLALLSVGCLIYFIHHVATSIQASSILKAITKETLKTIDNLYPDSVSQDERPEGEAGTNRDGPWYPVAGTEMGYVQHIDFPRLRSLAEEEDAVLRLELGPGDFASAGTPLVSASRAVQGEKALQSHFVVGDFRTVEQDVGFGIRQIVDIAMKALSPGVNDTSTAVTCLDHLGALLCRLTGRRLHSPTEDSEGERRLIAPSVRFSGFLAGSFDEIRLCAAGNPTILLKMLEVIRRIAAANACQARVGPLLEEAREVAEMGDHSIAAPHDRIRFKEALALTRAALEATESGLPDTSAVRKTEPWG